MLNVFVLDVLGTFGSDEKSEFLLFLKSPFFNKGVNQGKLVGLAGMIFEAQKRGKIETLDRPTIFKRLYPGKPVVESKVDKLMTDLKRLVQTFLAAHHYFAAENQAQLMLGITAELRQRGLENRYFQMLDKIKNEADRSPWETVENFFLKHLVAKEEHEWLSTFNKAKGDINIPSTILHLDNYYWSLKTELLNRLLLQRKMAVLSPDALKIIAENWEMPEHQLEKNALATVIWEIHTLLKQDNPDIEHVYKLLDSLQKDEAKFHPENLIMFYSYLRSICSFMLDTGKSELLPVLHTIQRDNLKRGYFYFDGHIPPNAFLSIVQTAINVGEIAWAQNFVDEHKGRILDENETNDFYRTTKALCLFAEKKYDAALEIIPFGSSYSFFHLLARRLELKIYYQLDSDLLFYKIDAFKMFISRAGNKVLSENLHELNANFINFLRQLSQSPKIRDKTRSAQIIKRIEEKKLVAERSWLLEKARELGGKPK